MKKLVLLTVLLLSCINSYSGNPIEDPFRLNLDWHEYPNSSNQHRKFKDHCSDYVYKKKNTEKLLSEHEKLINKYPDTTVPLKWTD